MKKNLTLCIAGIGLISLISFVSGTYFVKQTDSEKNKEIFYNTSEQNSFIQDDIPEIKYSVQGLNLLAAKDEKVEFTIQVNVPRYHHAYLDKGDEGILIPLSFDFSRVESAGYKVSTISKPKGDYDKEVKAKVLRGIGDFQFSIRQVKGEKFITPPIKAISQICNDNTKRCYFPKTDSIPLLIKQKKQQENNQEEN